MKRIIEKFNQKRQQREKDFRKKLEEIDKKSSQELSFKKSPRFHHLLTRLGEAVKSEEKPQEKKRRLFAPSFSKFSKTDSRQDFINQQFHLILTEFQNIVEHNFTRMKELLTDIKELVEINSSLADARDKEWDVLGSNHVKMIFDSMKWRVDKLAAEYQDVKILMKKFLFLKEKLNRLLSVLEEKKTPSIPLVKELLEPLEDWRYLGFENRFRGYEEQIKKQQEIYIPYFKKKGKILDLGCGRGEFLELLDKNGIQGEGIDINAQMIEICQEKGFNCQKGDMLEKLADWEDGSLDGIFSSQVIEHLPPAYLARLVELAYFKLSPSSYLILETINPTSVFALVQVFYLDLSHQRPIHPQALKFLMESAGFQSVEIKYSSPIEQEKLTNLPGADEISSILNQNIDNLNKLLYAPSNYAAIGKKV